MGVKEWQEHGVDGGQIQFRWDVKGKWGQGDRCTLLTPKWGLYMSNRKIILLILYINISAHSVSHRTALASGNCQLFTVQDVFSVCSLISNNLFVFKSF